VKSYRDKEALSDIFMLKILNVIFIKILSSLLILPIICFNCITRLLRKHDVIKVCIFNNRNS